jgi:hypothetical protein
MEEEEDDLYGTGPTEAPAQNNGADESEEGEDDDDEDDDDSVWQFNLTTGIEQY